MSDTPPALDVLLFSRTMGFRHASIQPAVDAFEALCRKHGWTLTHSEDNASFSHDRLGRHHAIVLLNTTGDVLNAAQREAFESYVSAGGGVLALHAAAVIDFEWPWYESLLGTRFVDHPQPQRGVLHVEDPEHPALVGLPKHWEFHEEWYNYRENPRGHFHVLASVDEKSYRGGRMGDHPVIWCHQAFGGRFFYTGLGHDSAAYSDAHFLAHLTGALNWVAARPTFAE